MPVVVGTKDTALLWGELWSIELVRIQYKGDKSLGTVSPSFLLPSLPFLPRVHTAAAPFSRPSTIHILFVDQAVHNVLTWDKQDGFPERNISGEIVDRAVAPCIKLPLQISLLQRDFFLSTHCVFLICSHHRVRLRSSLQRPARKILIVVRSLAIQNDRLYQADVVPPFQRLHTLSS